MTKCANRLLAVGLGLIWIAACGGRSLTDGNGSGGAQNGSAGAQNGSAGAAGISSAGSPSSAGASGLKLCELPEQPGNCDAYQPSFWHNPKTGLCEPFIYGGCQGNGNRFATREECLRQCPGGGANWGSCNNDSDCTITEVSCCASCEPVQDQQLLAISLRYVGDEGNMICPSAASCAPCPAVTEYDETRKYFKPVCKAHQCSVLDVRQSPLTECKTDAECTLRDGVNCCAECDGTGYVPVNVNATFCDSTPTACPGCTSTGAEKYQTVCTKGVCAFRLPLR